MFKKSSNKTIPQIEFYSSIDRLKKDFSDAMRMVGFEGKWRNNGKRASIYGIYGKDQVYKYIELVGFHNPKNNITVNKCLDGVVV